MIYSESTQLREGNGVNDMSHTCHVRYVYAWRYDGRHVHILTIVIWGGG
eukprot:COSAG01_NODE_16570_length_1224_cov_11.970667_1_plen_48_part_10